jgi:peptidyl-prolyl isomerase D
VSLSAGTKWTSGALYDDAARTALIATEQARLQALRNDEALPLVYLDVAIKGKPVGRIHLVLFTKQSPRAAENFRQLCTGVG